MVRVQRIVCLTVGTALCLVAGRVQAFPGQTPDEATVWIRAHPTLRPAKGERLLVRKTDTAAQRFTFLSSPAQVGKVSSASSGGVIRTEEIAVFDMINGVTRDRLQEYLRVIYGPIVYQDYSQAKVVYRYPNQQSLGRLADLSTPLSGYLQGELREGDRYAYWSEMTRQPKGSSYTGRMTVFLKEDLPKLETELQGRNESK